MNTGHPASAEPTAVVLRTPDDAVPWVSAWDDLSHATAEGNICYDRVPLLSAWRHFGPAGLRVVLVRDERGSLLGLVPLVSSRKGPLWVVETWVHTHAFLGTPLVRAGREREFWFNFLEWWETATTSAVLKLNLLRADGPIYRAWEEMTVAREQPWFCSGSWERALIQSDLSADAYLEAVVSAKKRKNVAKQEKKLRELGEVAFQRLASGEEVEPWLQEFLALEQSGWKGREGTSLRSDPRHEAFFLESMRAAHAAGGLIMNRLRLGDKTLAATCDVATGRAGFSFKVAYEESFHVYSPGFQLELFNLRQVLTERRIDFMDSCASPDHSVVNALWQERRRIAVLWVGRATLVGRAWVAAVQAWRRRRPTPSVAAAAQD